MTLENFRIGWKFSAVTEGYTENPIKNKEKIANKILVRRPISVSNNLKQQSCTSADNTMVPKVEEKTLLNKQIVQNQAETVATSTFFSNVQQNLNLNDIAAVMYINNSYISILSNYIIVVKFFAFLLHFPGPLQTGF